MVTLKQKKIQRRRGKQGEPQGSMQNPFEQIRSRKKFDVLGKKTKGTLKRTTQLRSAATEKVRLGMMIPQSTSETSELAGSITGLRELKTFGNGSKM